MDGRRSPNMPKERASKKAIHSTSKRDINYAPNALYCKNISKHSRMKNHSTCSLFEECKTNDFKKVHLSKRKKRSKPRTQRPIILINKFHMSLANYIQEHKSEIKLCGTKRFCEKTGEYYLNNVQLEQSPNFDDYAILPTLSLREPTNLVNCIMKSNGLSNLSSKASDILTKLPDNSLTPIPTMYLSKLEIRNKYEGKKLSNAERTAVHIRRLEYSTIFHRRDRKMCSKKLLAIILIQQWWKVMYSIIRIQKFYRGRFFRRRLLDTLNIEETELERIFFLEKVCDRLFIRRSLYQIFNSVGLVYSVPTMKNIIFVNRISVKKSLLKKIFQKWKAKSGLMMDSYCDDNNDGYKENWNSNDSNWNRESDIYYTEYNDNNRNGNNKSVIKRLINYNRNIHLLPVMKNAKRHLFKYLIGNFFNKIKTTVPYLNSMPGSKTVKTIFTRKRHPSMKKYSGLNAIEDNDNENDDEEDYDNDDHSNVINNDSNENNSNSDNNNICQLDKDNDYNQSNNGKKAKVKQKPITPKSILKKHFYKWIDYLNNKAQVNRIVSSLAYMLSSQNNSKGILTQRIRFGPNKATNLNSSRTDINANKNSKRSNKEPHKHTHPTNTNIEQNKELIKNNSSQYVYYKKTPSVASHFDDSNDKNTSSIQSSSQLDKQANRIQSEDGLFLDNDNRSPIVQKTNSNQLQSIGDDCTEVKALLTRSTIEREIKETQTEPILTLNKCIGTNGADKQEVFSNLVRKRVLKEYYLRFCALDPHILQMRTSSYQLRKYHRRYVNTMDQFANLGMKKFYFDYWKYLHEKKEIVKAMVNNSEALSRNIMLNKKAGRLKGIIQKKSYHSKLFNPHCNNDAFFNAEIKIDVSNSNTNVNPITNTITNMNTNANVIRTMNMNPNINRNTIANVTLRTNYVNGPNLQLYFNQWKDYTQKTIQNELISFELLRVLLLHHKKHFITQLKTAPYIQSAKKNKINSLTNHKLMRQKIEEEIKSRKSPPNKRTNFNRFFNEAQKIHHTTTGFEETKSKYSLHTFLSHSHSPFQKTEDDNSNVLMTRNKTENGFYEKRDALAFSSSKLNLSKIDKELQNKEEKNEAYYLIPENKATLAPTIYSSQSFFLKKETYQEPDPMASKLHSDFLSLFDHEKPVVQSHNTQRIQVTKATVIAWDNDDNNEGFNNDITVNDNNANEILKKKVIEKCSKDINKREYIKEEAKQKSKIKTKAKPPEQFYALPFNDNLREQLNVVNDDDLQRFDLINHGKIYNMTSLTSDKQNKPSSAEKNLTAELISPKSSIKKRRTNSCSNLTEKDHVFQLTEINSTQFYHTPIKESASSHRNNIQLGTMSIYTNVSKSTRRGKKPSFKKKSTENTIVSSSLLSTLQQDKPTNSAKNLTIAQMPKPKTISNNNTTLYNTDNNHYVAQMLSSNYNQGNMYNMYQHQSLSQHDNQFQCQNQYHSNQTGNADQVKHQQMYQDTLPVYFNRKPNDDMIMMQTSNANNTKQYSHASPCAQSIPSKAIQFKSYPNQHPHPHSLSRNQDDQFYSYPKNNTVTNSIIYKSNESYDYHIERDFFNLSYRKLFLQKLFTEATFFRKKDNLHYLIKITFHFKYLSHLRVIRMRIANWQKSIRKGNSTSKS